MNFLHGLESKLSETHIGGAHPEATQFFAKGYQPGNWAGRFNLDADVTAVQNAMKVSSVGTRERDLLPIICERPNGNYLGKLYLLRWSHRSRLQAYLQDLRAAYHKAHHLDLLTRIRIETSGQHQRMFEALVLTKPELRAHYFHEAVSGVGTNEMLLIDTLLALSNAEMEELKAAYKHHHLIGMQGRADFDTSGVFQKLLDASLTGSRPEGGVDQGKVQDDLITLFNATEGKVIGTDEKAIVQLIEHRSKAHLMHLNEAYKQKSKKGRTFVEEITVKQHGYAERAFVAYFLGPVAFTAFRIHTELKGHIKADWEGLLRSLLIPTEDNIKGAIRVLRETYKVDLHERINHFFFGGELKEAMSRYVQYCDANGKDSGERAITGDGSTEWVDPAVPAPEQGHANKLHLSRNQKIGLAVGIGAGVALLGAGIGVAAYEHNKHQQPGH